MIDVYREPISGQPITVNEDYEIDWRGTIGVGDILYGLNAAHALAKMYDHPIKMNVFWTHDEDYVYHYDDPETIIERTHVLHSLYHNEINRRCSPSTTGYSARIYSNVLKTK